MTEKARYYTERASVYPGEYAPVPWEEKEMLDAIDIKGSRIVRPPVNISELEDHYKVEMAVPGFKAGDFHINTNGCVLTIAALNKKPVTPGEEHYHIRSFACERIHRRITLPVNTDTNFMAAEYRDGILAIYFFKTRSPAINQPGRIVVY
jgi:HSP20 family molecular chaperone IbpA